MFIVPMLCDRVMLELAYKHPRTGKLTRSRQAVRSSISSALS